MIVQICNLHHYINLIRILLRFDSSNREQAFFITALKAIGQLVTSDEINIEEFDGIRKSNVIKNYGERLKCTISAKYSENEDVLSRSIEITFLKSEGNPKIPKYLKYEKIVDEDGVEMSLIPNFKRISIPEILIEFHLAGILISDLKTYSNDLYTAFEITVIDKKKSIA